jgi:cyclopropane fatty-acyl-phospholipid synthase-like methyltransferase
MSSIVDDRGFNQGFTLVKSTEVRMRRRADWFQNEMTLQSSHSVLEIGCGTGEVSYWIAENTKLYVLGTDLCVPFIAEANSKYQLQNLSFEVLDFNNPDQVKDRKFDYIIGNGILHHLYYNLPNALTTIKNLLTENGKMIFMEPNIYNPYCAMIFNIPFLRKMTNLEPDEMAFSKSFITKKLKEAGFTKVEVKYKDFLLPGVPEFMIKPSIIIGDILEKLPIVNKISQSIFIVAEK